MFTTFVEFDSIPQQEGVCQEAFSTALYYEDVFTVAGVNLYYEDVFAVAGLELVVDPTCCNALSTVSSCCPGAVHPASLPFCDETKPLLEPFAWLALAVATPSDVLVISNRKGFWGSGVHSY